MVSMHGATELELLTNFSSQGFSTTHEFRASWFALETNGLVSSTFGFDYDFCGAQHVQIYYPLAGLKRFAVVHGYPILYSLPLGKPPLLEQIGSKQFLAQLNKLGQRIGAPSLCDLPQHRQTRRQQLRQAAVNAAKLIGRELSR